MHGMNPSSAQDATDMQKQPENKTRLCLFIGFKNRHTSYIFRKDRETFREFTQT
jgi:hypothetical protein